MFTWLIERFTGMNCQFWCPLGVKLRQKTLRYFPLVLNSAWLFKEVNLWHVDLYLRLSCQANLALSTLSTFLNASRSITQAERAGSRPAVEANFYMFLKRANGSLVSNGRKSSHFGEYLSKQSLESSVHFCPTYTSLLLANDRHSASQVTQVVRDRDRWL